MERHRIFGQINEVEARPDPAIIERFRAFSPVAAFDAMGRHGSAHYEIKPIFPGLRICGPAVTVWTRATDALYVLKVSDVVRPGDVVVVDAGGVKDFCCMGDQIAWYLQREGAAGVVVDGGVRDTVGLREVGLPVFARSVAMPLWPAAGPGAINVPIQCGGIPVEPGDLILGDDDGVVIVPRADCERVLELTEAHVAREEARRGRMERREETYIEAMGLTDRIAHWTAAAASDRDRWEKSRPAQ